MPEVHCDTSALIGDVALCSNNHSDALLAASVVILLAVSSVIFNQPTEIEIYSENEVKEITLPDQSILTLNKNSKIVYDSDFGKEHRDIQLSGSAYFDVERNEALPFTRQIQIGLVFKLALDSFNPKKS